MHVQPLGERILPVSRRTGGDDDDNHSEDDLEQQEMSMSAQLMDGRTPLHRTIDRIGMGSYQWTLLVLCGFGWMADNMWIQTIAIILPRVQQHYAVPDGYIGYLSSSMFFGMMIGAIGWGSCFDLLGRSMAFNLTLFFTSLVGVFASLSQSYPWLCVALFFLGTSVGVRILPPSKNKYVKCPLTCPARVLMELKEMGEKGEKASKARVEKGMLT